ncbi:3-dehydroquinate synthase [Planococcus lenghuensis]|uniref:3-dehydroquinate synthase n=1 Tax=Planococcus lenghuensis TaxID=2213202 RepID=A0A1Q2KZP5_9BACL|nr:3-dehydroquinate synthase [Planococcus lenghuensis]AQQ53626.1 3-dehydroquinate synthase [Planococcus lenghuensis]
MQTVEVNTAPDYRVHIGHGAYQQFKDEYRPLLNGADKIAVVADEQAWSHHGSLLLDALGGLDLRVLKIPAGEQAKNADTFMAIHSFLLENNCSRKSVLIAFGGGAAGDVAGFAASTFMRGIVYFQCPTTILAHDSAVGGKTAINHPSGKNMIGTFYQPAAVLYETRTLATLPEGEVRSGMAEVIKHAFISNPGWLEELLKIRQFSAMPDKELETHLAKGIAVKAAIVEEDEQEHGARKFLNFGHTLAHAIEGNAGYGQVTHGEAVALGMVFDLLIEEHPRTDEYVDWCRANGYPLNLLTALAFDNLLPYMKRDKKSSGGELVFIALPETGVPAVAVLTEEKARIIYGKLQNKIREVLA